MAILLEKEMLPFSPSRWSLAAAFQKSFPLLLLSSTASGSGNYITVLVSGVPDWVYTTFFLPAPIQCAISPCCISFSSIDVVEVVVALEFP